jgi:predicted small secreted protein
MPNSALLRSVSLAGLLVAAGAALVGCNTVKGFGQDVQAVGSAMSGTAQNTKDEMTK